MTVDRGTRRRRKLLIIVGIVLSLAVAVAGGIAYDPSAARRTILLHVLIVGGGVGIIELLVGVVLIFVGLSYGTKNPH